jgi:hypothetical protein
MSTSSMARMQYITAECTTEIGELRFPRTSHPVPSKSNTAEPSASFISTRRQICHFHSKKSEFPVTKYKRKTCRGAIIQIIDRAQDISPKLPGDVAQEAAHRTLCVVSYVVHVFLNCFQAIVFHNYENVNRHSHSIESLHTLVKQLDAFVVGGNLLETRSTFSMIHGMFRSAYSFQVTLHIPDIPTT